MPPLTNVLGEAAQIGVGFTLERNARDEEELEEVRPKVLAWVGRSEAKWYVVCRVYNRDYEDGTERKFRTKRENHIELLVNEALARFGY